MKEYTITIYETTNPNILKFETNHFITKNNNFEFKDIDQAKNSPLAQQLFYLPFVKTVYISGNFIALERYDIVQWSDVRDDVAQQIVEYLNSGAPIVHEELDEKKDVKRDNKAEKDGKKVTKDIEYDETQMWKMLQDIKDRDKYRGTCLIDILPEWKPYYEKL